MADKDCRPCPNCKEQQPRDKMYCCDYCDNSDRAVIVCTFCSDSHARDNHDEFSLISNKQWESIK